LAFFLPVFVPHRSGFMLRRNSEGVADVLKENPVLALLPLSALAATAALHSYQ